MEALDGNAIGGLLQEIFGTEMTSAASVCGNCGTGSAPAAPSRPGCCTRPGRWTT